MKSEVWPVRCRGHAQIRADAHGEAAAQSSSGRGPFGQFQWESCTSRSWMMSYFTTSFPSSTHYLLDPTGACLLEFAVFCCFNRLAVDLWATAASRMLKKRKKKAKQLESERELLLLGIGRRKVVMMYTGLAGDAGQCVQTATVAICCTTVSQQQSNLLPHLRRFGCSSPELFVSVSPQIWGWISATKDRPKT